MNRPKISVIMGIYNCEKTLPAAIESILSQTMENWQMIMCDDGSADRTYEIALDYVKKYPEKLILIRNEKNLGLNYTLNHCLKYAAGEYIARMDGDDISLPARFEAESKFLDEHPEYAIVSCPMIYFDENGEWGIGKDIEIPSVTDLAFHVTVHCHAPCMIRAEAYRAVGGYTVDKRFLRLEDINLWHKLYAAGYRGYNLQEPYYRMLDDRNAYHRRTFSSRVRLVYVQYKGYRMLRMPLRYYYTLVLILIKGIVLGLIPPGVYTWLHKRRLKG